MTSYLRRIVTAGLVVSACAWDGSARAIADPESELRTWNVIRGTHQCSLIRKSNGGNTRLSMELSSTLAEPTLFVRSPKPTRVGPGEIILLPSGATYRIGGVWLPAGLVVSNLPPQFVEQFASSNRLNLSIGGKKTFGFSVSEAGPAVRALQACHDQLMRFWGTDQNRFRALARKPSPIDELLWFADLRMPEEVKRNVPGGDTIMRFEIQRDGSVKDCRTVVSSGSAALDAISCAGILKNARFEPALDDSGAPTAVRVIWLLRWVL